MKVPEDLEDRSRGEKRRRGGHGWCGEGCMDMRGFDSLAFVPVCVPSCRSPARAGPTARLISGMGGNFHFSKIHL